LAWKQQQAGVQTFIDSQIKGTETSLPLSAYTGKYSNSIEGDVDIELMSGDKLAFNMEPMLTFQARHFHLDTFALYMVTAISLLVANFAKPIVSRISSEFELGTLFMYIFFVAIGAGANINDVLGSALPILMFIFVMVIVHLIVVVIVGRFIKLDLAEVMIASNACILGPAPAAALAASKGWKALVTPGILVGLFGYAVATFIGVALTTLLK
jgi:uncharacterized membrane protein